MATSICPACGWHNVQGAELCESCTYDLTGLSDRHERSPIEWQLLQQPVTVLSLQPPLIASPHASLHEVLDSMREHNASAVLIVEHEQVLGIFTERDYLYRVALQNWNLGVVPVHTVMTASPVMLTTSHSLAFALREMALGRYRHLPIMDEHHRCLGMLSAQAILECLLDLFETHRQADQTSDIQRRH